MARFVTSPVVLITSLYEATNLAIILGYIYYVRKLTYEVKNLANGVTNLVIERNNLAIEVTNLVTEVMNLVIPRKFWLYSLPFMN